ncbi:MAG TPA: Xaa-Pro peptidase family protein [Tepidisphaeraceae bacterium]|nr:Xaa-Pro peptidase family protein [Tepidisphaeraceae bacterium]
MKSAVKLSNSYLLARQKALREALATKKLDGMLITHPPDLAYLTGFTGDDSIGLITADRFVLVTDFRYQEQAQIEAPWLKIVLRPKKMSETLAKTVVRSKAKKIGFETNFTTCGQINALNKELKELGARHVRLKPLDDVLVNQRKIKDETEIEIIRKAIEVAEQAFVAVRSQIEEGQTENYLAGLLVFEMRKRGASDGSFQSIIATGAASSLPHYRPGETPIRRDQPLLIDWGAKYNGYCSDLTRTLLYGKVSPKIESVYKIVLEAQEAAIRILRPGVTTRQADKAARDVIGKAGYKKFFGHGLGHGIGRDIHELPTLRKTGEAEELRPGMIVTVEPGIYLPGEGGVRIEDDVLITPDGCQVMSSLDKGFQGSRVD